MKTHVFAAAFAFALVASDSFAIDLRQEELELSFDGAARIASLKGGDGRELVSARVPFAELTPEAGAAAVLATAVERAADGTLTFRFGAAGRAVLAVDPFDGGWTFRVVSVEPATAERLTLGCVRPVCTKYRGSFANVLSDDASFAAVRGYETASEMSIAADRLSVAYARAHGLVGKRFGLAAGARARAIPALRAMTVAAGVPRTELGGAWSLGAEGNRSSYMLEYHSSTNNESLVDLLRRTGTTTVNFHSWWHRLGRYEPNPDYYRGGYPDFTNMVAYMKRAGFKVSLHTLTGCIDPADPWITPEPSDHLVTDATYTLAAPLAADATELTVSERPIAKHDRVFTYSCNGNVLKVGKELIQYSDIRREKPYGFTGLTRGAFGTRAAAHPAAARCDYLHQRYLAFYPDPDGPLADEVAAAIARTFRDVQADQIYFDGSEGMGTRYGIDAMRRKIFAVLDQSKHPVLDEASCLGANNWWFHSRLGAWDCCDWAPKRFHDLHHATTVETARKANFLEQQMGWWYPNKFTKSARGHFLDEDEYFASRNAGADAAMSVQGLDFVNGPIPSGQLSLVTVIGWYERIRLARAFAPGVAERLAQPRAEFRLRQGADGVWTIRDAFVRPHRAAGEATARWTENFADAMPAALRVEALFGAAPYDSSEAVTALAAADAAALVRTNAATVALTCAAATDAARGAVIALAAENRGNRARGAWAGVKKAFPFPYRDFGARAALGVWVKGDGSGALLNVQVESAREYTGGSLSEHYVRLDFTGWKYLTFLLRERDAAAYCDFVWPYSGRLYPTVGRNAADPKHVCGVALWLNEIPAGAKTSIAVADVKFLAVTERTVEGATVTVNGRAFALPFALASGDFAELESGVWTRYDRFGEPLACGRANPPSVEAGANAFAFKSASPDDRVEVTVAALGPTAPALVPALTEAMKREMSYEYELPVRYCPAAGFAGQGRIAVRPGETARVVARTLGDAKGARLVLRQGSARHEIAIPGETAPLAGTWTYSVEGGAPAADFRLELSNRYSSGAPRPPVDECLSTPDRTRLSEGGGHGDNGCAAIVTRRSSDGGSVSPAEEYLGKAMTAYGRSEYLACTNTVVAPYLTCTTGDVPVAEGRIGWVRVEGVRNVRDIGGWTGLRPGRAFRGTEGDSQPGSKHGLFVTAKGRETMQRKMKIKTDLDLRQVKACPTPGVSTFGPGIRWMNAPIAGYLGAFAKTNEYAAALRVFADERNYPIYFHCWAGADRTGTVALLLEGLCGADEAVLSADYELTSFAGFARRRDGKGNPIIRFRETLERLKAYPGATLAEKIAAYMKTTLGLTDAEIAAIRRNLVVVK